MPRRRTRGLFEGAEDAFEVYVEASTRAGIQAFDLLDYRDLCAHCAASGLEGTRTETGGGRRKDGGLKPIEAKCARCEKPWKPLTQAYARAPSESGRPHAPFEAAVSRLVDLDLRPVFERRPRRMYTWQWRAHMFAFDTYLTAEWGTYEKVAALGRAIGDPSVHWTPHVVRRMIDRAKEIIEERLDRRGLLLIPLAIQRGGKRQRA